MNVVSDSSMEEDVANISAMFPDCTQDDIKVDLTLTQNVTETVNHILDGKVRSLVLSRLPGNFTFIEWFLLFLCEVFNRSS